jgi:hypothetical protein
MHAFPAPVPLPAKAARTSDVLALIGAQPSERVTVGDILAELRDRAYSILVVLLGLPNCLPMPPPIPLVCGLLLALVAVQMAVGRSSPWLPRALLHRSIAREDVDRAVGRALPILRALERWSRPRMIRLDGAVGMRVMGVVLLALALTLILAAPIVGQIPLGVAACLMGLGLVERDGLVVIGGLVVGLAGIALNVGFAYAIASAVVSLIAG